MKAFPKSLTTECPPCWQGQQTCILPVAQQPWEIWPVVATGADGEAKATTSLWRWEVNSNARTGSIVRTVKISCEYISCALVYEILYF